MNSVLVAELHPCVLSSLTNGDMFPQYLIGTSFLANNLHKWESLQVTYIWTSVKIRNLFRRSFTQLSETELETLQSLGWRKKKDYSTLMCFIIPLKHVDWLPHENSSTFYFASKQSWSYAWGQWTQGYLSGDCVSLQLQVSNLPRNHQRVPHEWKGIPYPTVFMIYSVCTTGK